MWRRLIGRRREGSSAQDPDQDARTPEPEPEPSDEALKPAEDTPRPLCLSLQKKETNGTPDSANNPPDTAEPVEAANFNVGGNCLPSFQASSAPLDQISALPSLMLDIAYNTSWMAVFGYGYGLCTKQGLAGSLLVAKWSAKVHFCASSFYCLFDALMRYDVSMSEVLSAGLSGCATGIFFDPSLKAIGGLSLPNTASCVGWAALAIMDSLSTSDNPIAKLRFGLHNGVKPSDSILVTYIKEVSVAATLGGIWGYACGLVIKQGYIGSFLLASSTAMVSAKTVGTFSLVRLLSEKLWQQDNALVFGLAGCSTSLLSNGTVENLLVSCLQRGSISAFAKAMSTHRPLLPRFPKVENGMVLPPFTLPIPNDLLDGFSLFQKSLKKDQ